MSVPAARLLVVDDEPTILELLSGSLRFAGYEVITATSGAEAVRGAAQSRPDLILLDVMMPGMDGPTTLTHLQKNPRTSAIPVVFMTARAQPREIEHFIGLGAQGVISKPFDPMTLAAQVHIICSRCIRPQASEPSLSGAVQS
jgi:two-component system, OmpR family, response regulator